VCSRISVLTVLGGCVLLRAAWSEFGLSFAFAFECVREFGSWPFLTSQGPGTRSDYVYLSFTTMATVG
jgi:hypothetical protein